MTAPQAGRPAHHRGAFIPALVGVACLLSVVFLLPQVLRPADIQRYYLALVLTALTLLPLVIRLASGSLDVFEPIIPISLLIGLTFGLRALYIAYQPQTVEPVVSGLLPFADYVDRALVLAIAAYGALLAGYFIVAGPLRLMPLGALRMARTRWAPSGLDHRKVALLLGLGAIATVLTGSADRETVTNSTSLLGISTGFVHAGACILALHMAAGDKRRWLRVAIWAVALPLAAWQSLAFGAKAYVLQFFYLMVAARHYTTRRVRLAPLAVGGALVILAVFPVVNSFRNASSERRVTGGILNQISEIPASFSGTTPGEYVTLAVEGLMSRSTGVDALSLLAKYDVSRELGDAAAYAAIPAYAFIPRVLWPDKPVLNQGTRFGRLLLVPSFEGAKSFASFGIFHIGDLFVSFGVAGVLIGMCLLGCLYRLFYTFFDPLHTPDLGIKFLYLLSLWSMVNGFESDIPSVYSNLLKNLAVWVAIKMWMNQPGPDRTAQRAVSQSMRVLPLPARPPLVR